MQNSSSERPCPRYCKHHPRKRRNQGKQPSVCLCLFGEMFCLLEGQPGSLADLRQCRGCRQSLGCATPASTGLSPGPLRTRGKGQEPVDTISLNITKAHRALRNEEKALTEHPRRPPLTLARPHRSPLQHDEAAPLRRAPLALTLVDQPQGVSEGRVQRVLLRHQLGQVLLVHGHGPKRQRSRGAGCPRGEGGDGGATPSTRQQ